MFKVGLTGNYYSGQVEVSEILLSYDVPVFDGNLVTKFLLNYSPKHIKSIINLYGEDSYKFGCLNTKKFKSNKDYDKLFDLIEFDLLKFYELFRLKHKNETYAIFLFDHLFERGLDKLMNYNISCYRPKYQRKSDMKYLTTFPYATIENILGSEMSEFEKNKKSDFVINNFNLNGDYKSDIVIGLETQVLKLHKLISNKKKDSVLSNHYPLDVENIEWN